MNRQPRQLIHWPLVCATAFLLTACGTRPPAEPPAAAAPSCPPPQPCPICPACPPAAPVPPPATVTAPAHPALLQADWAALPEWARDDLREAFPALRESCGPLARQPHWQGFCEALTRLGPTPGDTALRNVIEEHLRPWSVHNPDGSTHGLVTGYYEPLIQGSRTRSSRYAWPIHGVPADMLTIDFGELFPELKHLRLRGRLSGNRVVPYWTRAELDSLQERLPAPILLWAADPIDLFFLQVQGSGRVELPDGSRIRIGYADQNGHPYQSIGRWLVSQGELTLEKASMEGIRNWAQSNPGRLTELLHANPSYVFFRELPPSPGGPIGAQGVPLTAKRSIAIDPRTIPLGAPVFLATTEPLSQRPLNRLVVAQDTGGAIKGAVRADFFWGFGNEAGRLAGRMRQQGQMWVLLPKDMSAP